MHALEKRRTEANIVDASAGTEGNGKTTAETGREKNRAWRNEERGDRRERIELRDTGHKINRRIFIPFRGSRPFSLPLSLSVFLALLHFVPFVSLSPPFFPSRSSFSSLAPRLVLIDRFINDVADPRLEGEPERNVPFFAEKRSVRRNTRVS